MFLTERPSRTATSRALAAESAACYTTALPSSRPGFPADCNGQSAVGSRQSATGEQQQFCNRRCCGCAWLRGQIVLQVDTPGEDCRAKTAVGVGCRPLLESESANFRLAAGRRQLQTEQIRLAAMLYCQPHVRHSQSLQTRNLWQLANDGFSTRICSCSSAEDSQYLQHLLRSDIMNGRKLIFAGHLAHRFIWTP